jgi:murein DD-endopeptidase MepM/ murein hydrolase activator NlpD
MKGFYGFGEELSGNRINPNFEYSSVDKNADILSAIDGVVVDVKEQSDTKDSEVFIVPNDKSPWVIGYDHLTQVSLKRGDIVKAGQPIGKAAVQNNGLHRFEFQINKKNSDGSELHYCPTSLLAASVKSTVENEIKAMMTAWEAIGGAGVYDESKFSDFAACRFETLDPAAAEGR